jgi:hypothetical protein
LRLRADEPGVDRRRVEVVALLELESLRRIILKRSDQLHESLTLGCLL